jgi:hypothetical protein
MSNKQQMTVQWFAFELSKLGLLPDGVPDDIYKQAKEMERERMIDFSLICVFGDTDVDPIIRRAFAEVFNETYAGKDDKQDQQI